MILHSLTLSGWRSFLKEVVVGPLSDGLNVIHGPNGTGKSTLFEALCRGLLDGHSVGGQDISAIQPWGRDLSPAVTVEFSHHGTEYRIAKQFLSGAHSKLERKEDGKYRPLANGRAADDQVRELLTKNPPGRGLSQPKNWGLAQALWAPQGSLLLSDLSGDLISDIRDALGVQLSDTSAGLIERRVEEVYLQFFTPTGRIRTGSSAPELLHVQEGLEKARHVRQEASERLLDYEETSRKVEDLRARRAQARLDAEELTKTIKQSRGAAETYRALLSEAGKKRSAASTAEAQYGQLKQHIDTIQGAQTELSDAQSEQKVLSEDAPGRRREVESRDKELSDAKAALENAQKGRDEVDKTEQRARAARRYVSSLNDVEELDKRIGRIETAEEQLKLTQQARTALVAPDRRTITAIRKAVKQRDDAQVLIDASLITLEVVPQRAGSIDVVAGEETGTKKLSTGKPVLIKGSPEVVAELEGIARFRASGPTGDVDEHREQLQRAQQRISELSKPYGTDDIDSLETLLEKAKVLDSAVNKAETEREAILDNDALDELKQERATLDATLTELRKDYPQWEEESPQPEALEGHARDLRRELDEKVAVADGKREKAQAAFSEANEQEKILLTRLSGVEKQVGRLQERLVELIKDGKTTEERDKELRKLLMAWNAAKASQDDLEEKLKAYEDDPSATLEKLENQLLAAEEAVAEARDKEMSAEGRLESLAARGPYSAFVAAEEEVERLEDAASREQLRVDAIKLLYDTVQQCRSEAVATVAKPVEQTATRFLQRIAGRRIGQVQLGEAFAPSAVVPETLEEAVDINNLSGGEKEQLYLATRLALAEVLAKEERQLVVLDDVLTATDTGRFARIMNILEDAAQQLQILVLTCHPERYRGLAGAEFFDLEALINT